MWDPSIQNAPMGPSMIVLWHERGLIWLPLVPLHHDLLVGVHALRTLRVHARLHCKASL